jgi:hypothetical protein
MKRWFVWCLVASTAWSLAPRSAAAVDTQLAALAGLSGVYIVAEPQGEKRALEGITANLLVSDVGERLRGAGIHTYTAQEMRTAPGSPFVYVRLGMVRRKDGGTFVYNLALQLQQMATLTRKADAVLFAATWQSGGAVGIAGPTDRVQLVRRALREQVDQFILAYRTANPGG